MTTRTTPNGICEQLGQLTIDVVHLARGREYSIAITKLEEAMFWIQRGAQRAAADREQRIAAEREHEEATGLP